MKKEWERAGENEDPGGYMHRRRVCCATAVVDTGDELLGALYTCKTNVVAYGTWELAASPLERFDQALNFGRRPRKINYKSTL